MMKDDLDIDIDYGKLFKKEGIRNTKHRSAVTGILSRSGKPLTAEEIFISLKENKSPICLSTVYRILETLAHSDIVVKTTAYGSTKARFAIDRHDHRHCLICLGCKKEIAIEGCPLGKMEEALARDTDFDVTGHRLEVYGYCPDCKHM